MNCPSCHTKDFYDGLMGPSCVNPSCVHYDQSTAVKNPVIVSQNYEFYNPEWMLTAGFPNPERFRCIKGKYDKNDMPMAAYFLSKEMPNVQYCGLLNPTNFSFLGNCKRSEIYFNNKVYWMNEDTEEIYLQKCLIEVVQFLECFG